MQDFLTRLDRQSLKAISFDLDDTLHAYRNAASAAMDAVYVYIAEEYGRSPESLHTAYADILANAQSLHFTEDKPAREYRRSRFDALLQHFSIVGLHDTENCLDIYQDALDANMVPLPGAKEALVAANEAGLTTLVVTEGPTDAQQHALELLGMAPLVTHLRTSSQTGLCKEGGLYQHVASELKIPGSQILHVGDNPERDGRAAKKAGWHALIVGKDDNRYGLPHIAELSELTDWLNKNPAPAAMRRGL